MPQDRLLPPVATLQAYRRVHGRPEAWRPALEVICQRHGLPPGSHRLTRVGSHVVALRPGQTVVKLYCPLFPEDHQVESRVLRHLQGQSLVPVPEIRAEGQLEGWPYLLLSFLEGQPLEHLWKDLSQLDQERIGRQLGEDLVGWHQISSRGIEDLGPVWGTFLEDRVEDAVARQRAHGWGEVWLGKLPSFLDQLDLSRMVSPRPTLLHADLTGEHLLMQPAAHGHQVAGLIDWADSMIGHGEYDLVALCVDAVGCHGPAQRQALETPLGATAPKLQPAILPQSQAVASWPFSVNGASTANWQELTC